MEPHTHLQQQHNAPSPADLAAHRANLLAGLRTSNPRARVESPGAASYHALQQLQPNAPVFTPGGPQTSQTADPYQMESLQNHLAALQMSAMQSTPNIAASYGATQGQPQYQQRQDQMNRLRYQQQQQQQRGSASQPQSFDTEAASGAQHAVTHDDVNLFMRQRQAQQELAQRQMLAQQHLEALRLQASTAHLNQQQQVAQQQRALFAQIQAEYDQQLQRQQQLQAAQEQRQAAQASIQANLRTRQAQQLYAQLVQEKMNGTLDPSLASTDDLWHAAVNAVDDHHAEEQAAAAASFASTQEQLRILQAQQYQLQMQQQQQQQQKRQTSSEFTQRLNERSGSPHLAGTQRLPSKAANAQPRERVASCADKAINWRTRGLVDDNSETDSPSARSSRSFNSADETPQTSEEDVQTGLQLDAGEEQRSSATAGNGEAKTSYLPPRPESVRPTASRAASASVGPRPASRPTGSEEASATPPVSVISIQPCRQPRGPPTDFQATNFTTRSNARTRKDALNRLRMCSSPRVVSNVVA
ncbi:unnamed protein product [Parajaminaea phylloscopi]